MSNEKHEGTEPRFLGKVRVPPGQKRSRRREFRARHHEPWKKGDGKRVGERAKRGMRKVGDEAEMEEPVRVAHGRYGCKSAYETYKRFARTNTRPGVRPRRHGVGANRREIEYEEGRATAKRGRVEKESSVPDGFK